MEHFLPSVGYGREVPSVVGIVDTVVQLHGFIPVVAVWMSREAVVAGGFGGLLGVSVVAFAEVDIWRKRLLYVVEIIVRAKYLRAVVAIAEVGNTLGLGIGVIVASHMVGHEIDNHFHAGAMCALHE